ncbi:hypothetical protein NOS3756_53700 [Nostoc sp. NIES-3756]|nr:hypothetical protein [Nostoc sp. NIES-3756]BAT56365.1 hypothetical protein NOS3756_53700 [Nostoc sp. NIES-3756]
MNGMTGFADALEMYRVLCSANHPDIYPAVKFMGGNIKNSHVSGYI